MNRDEIAKVVRLVEFGWANGNFEPGHALVYAEGLADLPYGPTDVVVRRAIRTERFRCTVADIRLGVARMIGVTPPELPEAVDQAERFVRYLDDAQWAHPQPSEPEIHPTVRAALMATGASPTWNWLGSFRRVYGDLVEQEETRILSTPFTELPALEQPRD